MLKCCLEYLMDILHIRDLEFFPEREKCLNFFWETLYINLEDWTRHFKKADFSGVLCEEQTQKMRKNDQTTISLGLWGSEMELKCRDPQQAHIGPLLNVHTLFQLLSSIWRGNRGRTVLFQDLKRKKFQYFPS